MKTFKILFTIFAIFLLNAQVSAKGKYKWPEKDAFHEVMSHTFHPAEEGDFAPIRSRIDEMVTKAIAFKNSEIPSYFENKTKIRKSLKKLVKQTKAFSKKIKSGASDADLKEDFMALHDTFHTVVGLCKAEDEHNH